MKIDGSHVYEKDTDFQEYYLQFINERKDYPIIMKNIIDFEIHFKSIMAYHILTEQHFKNSQDFIDYVNKLKINKINLQNKYNNKRIQHMSENIESFKTEIYKYADIYCFFDRLSLGKVLSLYTFLERATQDKIFGDMKQFNMNFNVNKVDDFIEKVFCLVSVRNCVMHGNSLEILIRFYNAATHEMRNSSDKKKFINMIKALKEEKPTNLIRRFSSAPSAIYTLIIPIFFIKCNRLFHYFYISEVNFFLNFTLFCPFCMSKFNFLFPAF